MASPQYFDFIRNVWKGLSSEDQDRMAELWSGYEKVIASIYQKFIEAGFGTSVKNNFIFGDERWLPHEFNAKNRIVKSATYTTTQDLSLGVNLSVKSTIKFSWDLHAPIQVNIQGLSPNATTITEIVNKINIAAGFAFVKALEGSVLVFSSPTTGVNSKVSFFAPSNPTTDASEIVLGLGTGDLPLSVPEYPYLYTVSYPRLVEVPELRNAIRDENKTIVLRQHTDYIIINNGNNSINHIAFKQPAPAEKLWAKRNLFDDEYPWNNFGFLMDIYQQNSPRYAQIIQGLWFAFWTGPRPENLRKALYLLFQLPTSPYIGTITKITAPTTSPDVLGTITVTSDKGGVSTTFDIPSELEADVVLGERVEMFQPLVTGIDIFDKVNYPGFVETEIGRSGIQRFLTEQATRGVGADTDETLAMKMLEEYTFLPQISVNAFITPDVNIANVRTFLDAIKPVTRTYMFQVIVGTFQDKLQVKEKLALEVDITVDSNVDSNETTYLEQSTLSANETTPTPGMVVDTEGMVLNDKVEADVYSFGVLIDSFEV